MAASGAGSDAGPVAQVVSTALIIAALIFLVVPNFGYEGLESRLLATAAGAVVVALPIAVYMVYVRGGDEESHYFGPWGPADLLFLAVVVPVLVGVTWLADTYALTGVLYWLLIAVGLLVAVVLGTVVRSLALGEWPPGSDAKRMGDDGPGPF